VEIDLEPWEVPVPCRVPELLRIAEEHVPGALVTPEAWQRLHSIFDPLPAVASEAAVECRLGAEAGPVDFEMCIRPTHGGRQRLAEALAEPALQAASALSAGWRRALSFVRAWADSASPLNRAVAAVWLEFDVPERGETPVPFLVFTLDPEHFYADGTADPAALGATLQAGLDLLADGLDPRTARGLTQCLGELPRCGQLLHAAVRPAPEGDFARLVVRLPWRELPSYLERLDWRGSLPELRSHLERLCALTLIHSINLDVGAHIGPRVGIEFHHPTSPRNDRRWRAVFDGLEASQACTAEKRELLAEWVSSGKERVREAGSIRVRRELLVKAIYEPGAPLRAKAYLPFGPRLLLP